MSGAERERAYLEDLRSVSAHHVHAQHAVAVGIHDDLHQRFARVAADGSLHRPAAQSQAIKSVSAGDGRLLTPQHYKYWTEQLCIGIHKLLLCIERLHIMHLIKQEIVVQSSTYSAI